MNRHILAALALLVALAAAARADDDGVPQVTLTVYSDNFAVVKEDRHITLSDPVSEIAFSGIAATIDPETVVFRSLTDPLGTRILEQNYNDDLLDRQSLLKKYVKRDIVLQMGKGEETAGTLLSFDDSELVLRTPEGLVAVNYYDDVRSIRFPALPKDLLVEPTLVWKLKAGKTGKHLARVSYRATQIHWAADYNVIVNADDTLVDIGGWATVVNNSGTTFSDARLKLMGGDVRRIHDDDDNYGGADLFSDIESDEPAEKTFFEYHLYTFPNRTTIKNNQVKQLRLLDAEKVAVTKRYRYRGFTREYPGYREIDDDWTETFHDNVEVVLDLANTTKNHLGKALPAGVAHVYKRDPADDSLEFVGEDAINHTKVGDTVSLTVGNAFDVNGSRRVVDFQSSTSAHTMKEQVELTLTSAKAEPVEVQVVEKLSRSRRWTITKESDGHAKVDSSTIIYTVTVPAMKNDEPGKRVITYTVHYTW